MIDTFDRSAGLLEKTNPLGAQTFSKNKKQVPLGVSPLFAAAATGAELDGNRYVDFITRWPPC